VNRTHLAAIALVATLLVAACGSDGDGAPFGSGPAPGTESTGSRAAPTGPAATTPPTSPATSGESAIDDTTSTTPLPGGETPAPTDTEGPLVEPSVALFEIGSFDQPVDVAFRPNGAELYVVEQPGRVIAVTDLSADVVLDITDLTAARGEQGLLGLAFHPTADLAYVNYTDTNGDTVVAEFGVDPATSRFDRDSIREVLAIAQPYSNHNGGQLAFGPDQLLYIGVGDGGSGGDPERHALDLTDPLGAILRIDPTPAGDAPFTVPADNPFVGTAGADPTIWAYGLRNPWRFSFDPLTADLWVADVGQNAVEEVNLVRAADGSGWGVNFGWSAFEGTRRFHEDQPPEGALGPVHEYEHGDLGCSISGGEVYRGTAIPGLAGAYVFADYCVPGIRAIPAGPGPWPEATVLTGDGRAIAGFGRGPDGEVYALSLNGPVYRLDPA
jgi:glucose/arabinose dehydrogenase